MKLNITVQSDGIIPKNDLSFWLAPEKYDEFTKSHNLDISKPIYVKIVCNEPLKVFTVFSKLEKINPQTENIQHDLFVNQKFFTDDLLIDNNTSIVLSFLDISKLETSESISINLNESEVITWSEDEATFAINVFLSQNKIISKNQKVLLKAGTKKAVFGIVNMLYPDNSRNIPYKINNNTNVNLLGLPKEKQKVIDFSKIGGLQDIINSLREIIQIPLLFPDLLEKFDITPPRGLILHGPPGNGKTMIARAIAYSLGSKFISIEGPELTDKYVGQGEKRLREKFEEAYLYNNSVIFIDEIDSIAPDRNKTSAEHTIAMVSTLLNLMDGIKSNSNVFVIGATNRLNALDTALRRPGRFELEYEVPVPNKSARLDILKKTIAVNNDKILESEVDGNFIRTLSEITNGYSGADLISLYRQSSMNAIKRFLEFDDSLGKIRLLEDKNRIKLSKNDFLATIKVITPTSVRSYETVKKNIHWDDIIGLSIQKNELNKVHSIINQKKQNNFSERLSVCNISLFGKEGSGKTTLLSAFSDYYNYEIIILDFLMYANLSFELIADVVISHIKNTKQIAPAIIYLKNLFHLQSYESLLPLIYSELDKINNHYNLLACIEVEDKDILLSLKGYKKFNNIIDFNQIDKLEVINSFAERFNQDKKEIESFIDSEKLPIGQMINNFEELKIIKTIENEN